MLKKILLICGGLFALLVSCGIGAAAGGSDGTAEPSAAKTVTVTETADAQPADAATVTVTADPEPAKPAETVTVTATPKPKPKPEAKTYGDGTYIVGSEIPRGVYKSSGTTGDLCYAATESRGGDILDQQVADSGTVVVRIEGNAYTFETSDCGTFKKVG